MKVSGAMTVAWVAALGATLLAQRAPDEALATLQEGNRRFVTGRITVPPLNEGIRRSLAQGQSPFAIVICCADSRVPPEHVFNTGLGDLFVIRTAGTSIDPETVASVEYAAEHLGVQLCVVLTHESCETIAACSRRVAADVAQPPPPAASQAMSRLLERLEPAVRKASGEDLAGVELRNRTEEEQSHLGASECVRRSPVLQHLARDGRFRIVPARYHLATGEVEWLPVRPLPAPEEVAEAPVQEPGEGVPPHVVLQMLQAGHRRYLSAARPAGDVSSKRREQLTHGQRPLAIVVTCADSRVSPEHLFDAGLGELIVVRVAGNVLTDNVLATIEHGASHDGASLCVILGHTRCGAVTAAAASAAEPLTDNMRRLLARIEPAVERARAGGRQGADLVDLAIRHNVQHTLLEARKGSSILRQLEHRGQLVMLPAVYDLQSGVIHWLQDSDQAAVPPPAPAVDTGPPTHRPVDPVPGTSATAKPARLDWAADSSGFDKPTAGDLHGATGGLEQHHPLQDLAPSASPRAEVPPPTRHPETAGLLAHLDPMVLFAALGCVSLAGIALVLLRRRAG